MGRYNEDLGQEMLSILRAKRQKSKQIKTHQEGIMKHPEGLKEVKCFVGKDYFGFERAYIPVALLNEKIVPMGAPCVQCGRIARFIVVELEQLGKARADVAHGLDVSFLYCGECAPGG